VEKEMPDEEMQLVTQPRTLSMVAKRWSQQPNRYPGALRDTPSNSLLFEDWIHSPEKLTHFGYSAVKCLALLAMP
jgi:hypothetical protein